MSDLFRTPRDEKPSEGVSHEAERSVAGMLCVYCGGDTGVINSRTQKRANQVWRRRRCTVCKAVFTSIEAVELSNTLTVVSGDSTAPLVPERIYVDILHALKDRSDPYIASRELTNTVIKRLLTLPEKPTFRPEQISRAVATVLRRFDARAYLRFVAEHPSLQKNGPF